MILCAAGMNTGPRRLKASRPGYGVDKLVWFEIYDDVATAIAREKELKKWRRDWKTRLIEATNPGWG